MRCTATVSNGWTVIFRAADDPTHQCRHRAVRTFSDGSGYCHKHLPSVLQHHNRAVQRILSIPPRGDI